MKNPFLVLLLFLCLNTRSQSFTGDELEYMRQMSSRTAKQTWWFFDKRLKEPLLYTYQHIYLDFQHVYIRDIKQLSSGKYTGKVDLALPHDEAFNESNQELVFDSAEVDDWFMVDEEGYLLGGFWVRLAEYEIQQAIRKNGKCQLPHQSVNEDFIKSSQVTWREPGTNNFNPNDVFPGGEKGLKDSLHYNLEHPDYAHYMAIEGYVTVRFEIDEKGTMTKISVVRGVGGGLNESAKKAFRNLSPYWKPLYYDGIPEPYVVVFPIRFYYKDWEQILNR